MEVVVAKARALRGEEEAVCQPEVRREVRWGRGIHRDAPFFLEDVEVVEVERLREGDGVGVGARHAQDEERENFHRGGRVAEGGDLTRVEVHAKGFSWVASEVRTLRKHTVHTGKQKAFSRDLSIHFYTTPICTVRRPNPSVPPIP